MFSNKTGIQRKNTSIPLRRLVDEYKIRASRWSYRIMNVVVYIWPGTSYHGVPLGRLPTLAHQVTGDVYIVDSKHFLIKNFVYDGTAPGIE